MRRTLLALAGALALAACESTTAPRPDPVMRTQSHPLADADSVCRSGWSVANGRCG